MVDPIKMQQTLLNFPCLFPIKVMGEKQDALQEELLDITRQHVPGFIDDMLTVRESRQGNYVAFTFTVQVTSKAQLDALYQALTAHPKVKMVL